MKRFATIAAFFVTVGLVSFIAGCGLNEDAVRKIAGEEAAEAIADYKASFAPEKMGFGVVWEAGYSYAQGVKVGNMIFVSGQLAHDLDLDADGMPRRDFMTGKDFDFQMRKTLDNIVAVLEHFGASMDDVVMLQNFVDPVAGNNKAGDWVTAIAPIICEYFPNAQHTMTIMEISNLFGPEQLVESNAIAVVH